MIRIITGKLGQGKTLYCVMEMFFDLCGGHTVCTNIAVDWDEMVSLARRAKGVELDPAQLIRVDPEKDRHWHKVIPWGVVGSPVKVYLDEIHLFFNARDWAKTGTEDKSLLKFLTQSRKAAVDIAFIAQDKETIEKQFRVLAEWEVAIVSSDHLPIGPLGPLLRFFGFRCFIGLVRDMNKGFLLKRIWRKYDPRFFALYGSYTFLDSEMNQLYSEAVKVPRTKLRRVGMARRAWLNLSHPVTSILRKASK